MIPYVDDPDFTLHVGDALETLTTLPDGSVDCCVTSPPYWGLRDYGTGAWEGGDPDCNHLQKVGGTGASTLGAASGGNDMSDEARERSTARSFVPYADVCGKCGATRQDRQLGLEASPDEYVERLVGVFREVRRVLADHGSLWLNLGDSYAANSHGRGEDDPATSTLTNAGYSKDRRAGDAKNEGARAVGLKPKDLVGVPWRVAFALQQDGWYLRSDIVWSKPNPMPESVTDRPTKSHEYVFLLTKGPRYFYDNDAIREPHTAANLQAQHQPARKTSDHNGTRDSWVVKERFLNPAGRNARSVWEIATRPFPEAHFATYPPELVRRALLAGCPERVCRSCGKPSERIVEREPNGARPGGVHRHHLDDVSRGTLSEVASYASETVGWSDCGHNNYRPGTVLDPFLGSGTTALVAREHGRRCVGIELNPDYARMAARRLGQLSLLADGIGG